MKRIWCPRQVSGKQKGFSISAKPLISNGDPTGNRTRVSGVRGRKRPHFNHFMHLSGLRKVRFSRQKPSKKPSKTTTMWYRINPLIMDLKFSLEQALVLAVTVDQKALLKFKIFGATSSRPTVKNISSD